MTPPADFFKTTFQLLSQDVFAHEGVTSSTRDLELFELFFPPPPPPLGAAVP